MFPWGLAEGPPATGSPSFFVCLVCFAWLAFFAASAFFAAAAVSAAMAATAAVLAFRVGLFFMLLSPPSVGSSTLASSVFLVGLGRVGRTKDSGAVTASLELDVGVPTRTPDSREEVEEVEERLPAILAGVTCWILQIWIW